jgi:hypothetical protein
LAFQCDRAIEALKAMETLDRLALTEGIRVVKNRTDLWWHLFFGPIGNTRERVGLTLIEAIRKAAEEKAKEAR